MSIQRPKRGDTVFVPNTPDHRGAHEWIGGIVNGYADDGRMLVGVKGHHSGARMVVVSPDDYLIFWCYPGDVDRRSLEPERAS